MHWRKALNFVTNWFLVGVVFNVLAWLTSYGLHYLFTLRSRPLVLVPYCVIVGVVITARR